MKALPCPYKRPAAPIWEQLDTRAVQRVSRARQTETVMLRDHAPCATVYVKRVESLEQVCAACGHTVAAHAGAI